MKVQFIKLAGGLMAPANDMEFDKLKRFKTGEMYQGEFVLQRNPAFHRKFFAFMNFCFQHWAADKAGFEFMDQQAQFDTFREHLTVLAGYYEKTFTITGNVRIRAKSLAFGNMSQEEFEHCYSAMINVALKHIFNNTSDQNILAQLQSFF